ncbi:hypothetical protein HanXRQr2_Chr10g0449541 [Helianthus annuus]|uniref:Uncharacterized protein n=2 Tax=Helianthus annuus TaxID=4232 RepID=A0A9K3N541_HELAN|nr:hypothetical protein HanXRQr2_Chr10g0449541 [Helianthus annuus]KAJ0514439.1 hypothetical protein HanHA300_Chr10g0369541 [Helianthus annuus]KAJ0522621.1 hypothetical protein HanIR_Chr10g0484601 [Helianthus annuus]KAJ0530584.1 hypothetical protein HanHA89_Chr10g0391491 [Helianthus annuus]KAJ0697438.1 hypothetical protein HanLR1_Chr10g0368921 [Helianthus annuus]
MRGRHDHEAGPSHRRTPSASFSSDPYDDWRHSLEPVRRSVSLSTSPSYHHSFGPQQPDEPQGSHHSQRSVHSHHSQHFSHQSSPFQGHFDPNDYINAPAGHNLLGPEDHYPKYQDMDVDDDPDLVMPPSGTPTHPIDISSGFSFAGSPYRGPDLWAKRWRTYKWEFTSPHHDSRPPQRTPSEDPHFQVVTPLLPPAPEQSPPPEPSRRRRSARMSMRGGFHFSTPQTSNNYPPIFEDPQIGGPSNVVSEVDSAPVTLAPPPPPMGFENPIPDYADTTGYNSYKPQTYTGYNYHAPAVDPYVEAANFNTLYPLPFPPAYPTGYPAYEYQYPPPPQLQQPQPQEILQRLEEVEQKVEEHDRRHHKFLKGLANFVKGKKKKDH